MLDGVARRVLGPGLDRLGRSLARRGVGADQVTLLGFALGACGGRRDRRDVLSFRACPDPRQPAL